MRSERNLKFHRFTWPALFSFLILTFHPLPLWAGEFPLESASLDALEYTQKLNRFSTGGGSEIVSSARGGPAFGGGGETPLLYSDWKREQMKPFHFTFPDSDASPFPLLNSSIPQGKGSPSPSFRGQGPTPQANLTPSNTPTPATNPSPGVSRSDPPSSPPTSSFVPRPSPTYTPWIWDALALLRIWKDPEQKSHKKKSWFAQRPKQKALYPLHPSLGNKNNHTDVNKYL